MEHHPSVKTVGIDYLSIAAYKDNAETHEVLLGSGVMIIEGLVLGEVQGDSWYRLLCLPMKVEGAEGAPTRCVLMPS